MIVEAVPKSPAGKILRRLLKDTKGHLVHVVSKLFLEVRTLSDFFRAGFKYEEKVRAKL